MKKAFALLFGVAFVLFGLLGFTASPIVGAHGFFHTNIWHNLFHVLTGVLLLWAATHGSWSAKLWIILVGVTYLVIGVLGFVILGFEPGMLFKFFAVNMMDHWLHIGMGLLVVLAAEV